jgi:hypothetical protein
MSHGRPQPILPPPALPIADGPASQVMALSATGEPDRNHGPTDPVSTNTLPCAWHL